MTKEETIIEYGKLKVIRRGYDLELNDGKNIFIKPAYFKQGVAKNEKTKVFLARLSARNSRQAALNSKSGQF